MAEIYQIPSTNDTCLILGQRESCWIDIKPPKNWSYFKTVIITSLTENTAPNSYPQARQLNGANSIILNNEIRNQLIFGFTNNNNQLPNTANYTGNFFGVCNYSGLNSTIRLWDPTWGSNFGYVGFWNSDSNFGPLGAIGYSFLSQSDSSISGMVAAPSGVPDSHPPFDASNLAGKISLGESRAGPLTEPARINNRCCQIFTVTKDNETYRFEHDYNYIASMTGSGYAFESASRENMLFFTRSSSFLLTNKIPSVNFQNPIYYRSGLASSRSSGFTGETFEPRYLLINYPFPTGRLRIHGVMTEFYT